MFENLRISKIMLCQQKVKEYARRHGIILCHFEKIVKEQQEYKEVKREQLELALKIGITDLT